MFEKLIQFLGNNFEYLFIITLALVISYILAFLLVQIKQLSVSKYLHEYINNFTFTVVLFSLIFLCFYLYWLNYKMPKHEFDFSKDVLPSTHWVKENTLIYYIDKNDLYSIRINGKQQKKLFTAEDQIREYHFSPDGKYILIATRRELFKYDISKETIQLIDNIDKEVMDSSSDENKNGIYTKISPDIGINKKGNFKGVITGIRWSPDSEKFCYSLDKWSQFSIQNNIYVYDLKNHKKRIITTPTRRISSLYWDKNGDNLYYLNNVAKDTSKFSYPFEIAIYKIPVETLKLHLITRIPCDTPDIPVGSLELRDIDLFLTSEKLSFGQYFSKDNWIKNTKYVDLDKKEGDLIKSGKVTFVRGMKSIFDENLIFFKKLFYFVLGEKEAFVPQKEEKRFILNSKGEAIGIDEDDYLYFIKKKWFRKRLFKMSRIPIPSDIPRHQYMGGELAFDNINWLPNENYVIMEHKFIGVFILDPKSGEIGYFYEIQGNYVGWYDKNFDKISL